MQWFRLMFFVAAAGCSVMGSQVRIMVVPPVTTQRVLPDTRNIRGIESSRLFIALAPDEYRGTTVVLTPERNLSGIQFAASDLKAESGGVIPAAEIDISAVKCWYQDLGTGYQENIPDHYYDPSFRSGVRTLVPELLLKDLSLIRVDSGKKDNYVRVDQNGRSSYEIVSAPKKDIGLTGARIVPTGDRKVLKAHPLAKGKNQQYYIVVHAGTTTVPGLYRGEIAVLEQEKPLCRLELNVRVLPVRLEKGHKITIELCDDYLWDNSVPKAKMLELYRDTMKMRLRYGFRQANIGGGSRKLWLDGTFKLEDFLKIQKEAGFDLENEIVHFGQYDWRGEHILTPEGRQRIISAAQTARKFGVRHFEIYCVDEALSNNYDMKKLHRIMEEVHNLGLGITVSSCGIPAGHQKDWRAPGNFGFLGDVQDHFTCWGYPSREEAAKWHSKGQLISCYSNPMGGVEQPDAYRRNYGLLLWQYDYDGVANYAEHFRWGDFFTAGYKRFAMYYPTLEGMIPTVQLEGMREGLTDVRYVRTLEKMIAGSPESPVRKQAAEWIAKMKKGDINRDYDCSNALRVIMIRHLLALQKGGRK